MPIYTNSRYIGQPILQVQDTSGVYRPTVYGPPPEEQGGFNYYTVVAGDRFDLLAFTYLGSSDLWWRIADINPEVVYPDISLSPGSVIRIPVT